MKQNLNKGAKNLFSKFAEITDLGGTNETKPTNRRLNQIIPQAL